MRSDLEIAKVELINKNEHMIEYIFLILYSILSNNINIRFFHLCLNVKNEEVENMMPLQVCHLYIKRQKDNITLSIISLENI